jgi:hypothetical protein
MKADQFTGDIALECRSKEELIEEVRKLRCQIARRFRKVDLRGEPEINDFDRDKAQILDASNYVENAFLAVGFASRCWTDGGVFDTCAAIRIANELCAYMRLLKEGNAE